MRSGHFWFICSPLKPLGNLEHIARYPSLHRSSLHTAEMPKPTLIIHGASSFTARELLRYLDQHPESESFDFVLAGRTKEKLEKANKILKTPREVCTVDLKDESSVKKLIETGDVVVNLAGESRSRCALWDSSKRKEGRASEDHWSFRSQSEEPGSERAKGEAG